MYKLNCFHKSFVCVGYFAFHKVLQQIHQKECEYK